MQERIKIMRLLVCALVMTLLTSTSVYSYQPLQARTLVVTPANVLQEVYQRKQQQPSITASQLAQYANELVENRGFDYDFDVCHAVPRGVRTKAPKWTVRNNLSLSNGRKLSMEFAVDNPNEAYGSLCGECSTQIPSSRVTKHEILLVADGKQYRVRRPATFILDEAELVDASMEKVLRTWQLPYQTVPIGVSPDGAKLYLYIYQYELDDLVLELSEGGNVAFRDRAEVGLRDEGEWIENLPRHAAKTKLGFRQYHAGNKKYIVRFIPPCT
jgi:hypothetical protein